MTITVYVVECYDTYADTIVQCGMALTKEKAIESMNEILERIQKANCKTYIDYRVTEYHLHEDRYVEFNMEETEDE